MAIRRVTIARALVLLLLGLGIGVGIYVARHLREDEIQRRIWIGNSGYFAVLTALHMGYEKIILLGMPLNHEPHWYERGDQPPPTWAGKAYTQWMDLVIKRPEAAKKVRSMDGYSAFILGQATKDWF